MREFDLRSKAFCRILGVLIVVSVAFSFDSCLAKASFAMEQSEDSGEKDGDLRGDPKTDYDQSENGHHSEMNKDSDHENKDSDHEDKDSDHENKDSDHEDNGSGDDDSSGKGDGVSYDFKDSISVDEQGRVNKYGSLS